MVIATLGIDLAKSVFALHGVDATGKSVLVRLNVSRSALPGLVADLPPCLFVRAPLGTNPPKLTLCNNGVNNEVRFTYHVPRPAHHGKAMTRHGSSCRSTFGSWLRPTPGRHHAHGKSDPDSGSRSATRIVKPCCLAM